VAISPYFPNNPRSKVQGKTIIWKVFCIVFMYNLQANHIPIGFLGFHLNLKTYLIKKYI